MATLLQMVATMCVYYSMQNNVETALPLNYKASQRSSRMDEMTLAWGLTLATLVLELILMLFGFSLFYGLLGVFDTFIHTTGIIVTGFFILNEWHYHTFWYIFTLTALIPLVLECVAVASIVLFRHRPF